jgi:outer membrane murein-binding lipoprotein Lpp
MTEEDHRQAATVVRVLQWAVGIIAAVLAGGILTVGGWCATTLLDTRETMRVAVSRIERLESGDAKREAVPAQLATMAADIRALTVEVGALREDIRRVRTPAVAGR